MTALCNIDSSIDKSNCNAYQNLGDGGGIVAIRRRRGGSVMHSEAGELFLGGANRAAALKGPPVGGLSSSGEGTSPKSPSADGAGSTASSGNGFPIGQRQWVPPAGRKRASSRPASHRATKKLSKQVKQEQPALSARECKANSSSALCAISS